MWALWAATEVEPHALQVLMHRVSKPPAERDPKIAQAAIEALRAPFAVLDKELAATGFIVGGRFTVADINAAEVLRYAMAGAGAVRGRAAGEGVAGGMPGAAGVQGDVGQAGGGAGVRRRAQ